MENGVRHRAATYKRVAANDGDGNVEAFRKQDLAIRMLADTVLADIVAEFFDSGVSGNSLTRFGLDELIIAAERGEFEIVVVSSMSRLGRGDAMWTVYDEISCRGVQVISPELRRFGGVQLLRNIQSAVDLSVQRNTPTTETANE